MIEKAVQLTSKSLFMLKRMLPPMFARNIRNTFFFHIPVCRLLAFIRSNHFRVQSKRNLIDGCLEKPFRIPAHLAECPKNSKDSRCVCKKRTLGDNRRSAQTHNYMPKSRRLVFIIFFPILLDSRQFTRVVEADKSILFEAH